MRAENDHIARREQVDDVRTLADDTYEPGYHLLPLSADGLASGVYFCRMASEDFLETTKLLLLK